MRVVSLIPSITETLLEAGVNVVGRTRYCLYPEREVGAIKIVGGTKDLDWAKVQMLEPDLLVLEKEENLPWMKEQSPVRTHVLHVEKTGDLVPELIRLAELFSKESKDRLLAFADRWRQVEIASNGVWQWANLPGEIRRADGSGRRPAKGNCGEPAKDFKRLVYLIWRDPWMSVGRETFIASVFAKLGASAFWPDFESKYPVIDLNDFDPASTLLVFSSEPFPFAKKWDELASLPFARVLIDGEAYSWFGTRALRFLERHLSIGT